MSPAGAAALRWEWHGFDGWPQALMYAALRLRSDIFVVEQACIFPDMDGLDPGCEHLCGLDGSGALVAYARLLPPGLKYPEASIGRVIVALPARGTQAGRGLMLEALAGCARRYPGQAIRIGAQQRLERFYASLGFTTVTEAYLEDGIWHVDMLRPG